MRWFCRADYLIISTSAIYGSGEIHALELRSRKTRKIFPRSKDDPFSKKVSELCLTELTAVDSSKRSVSFTLTGCDMKTVVKGTASY